MNLAQPCKALKICLLAPWYGGSHRRWADELKRHSRHRIEILSLPSVHWKWRMHGAAVTLAEQYLKSGKAYDLILAEDMMDVAVFSGLIRQSGDSVPIVTYFHENQISYPVSPRDTDTWAAKDLRYGYINYTTALVSDRLYFNSQYHKQSFLQSLPTFLEQFPDSQNMDSVNRIREKSEVLPLGLDLHELDNYRPTEAIPNSEVPLILWNHRREYDKNPAAFFELILKLRERNLDFQLVILGKQSKGTAALFEKAVEQLGPVVIHNGEATSLAEYAHWLWRADIVPVSSIQEFFGGSLIEAVYCGCHPILPQRLAYPEHFPREPVYYDNPAQALDMLEQLIRSGRWRSPCRLSGQAGRYAWDEHIDLYDERLAHASDQVMLKPANTDEADQVAWGTSAK